MVKALCFTGFLLILGWNPLSEAFQPKHHPYLQPLQVQVLVGGIRMSPLSATQGEGRLLPTRNHSFTEALTDLGLSESITHRADLGYYGWIPSGPYRSVGSVSSEDIRNRIELTRKPNILVDLKALNRTLPIKFKRLKPYLVDNRYPYGQSNIASLYVAVKDRGVKLEEVDFLFGSYTLFFLATGAFADDGEKLVVARVPGSSVILVTRYKLYTDNLSQFGSQFERLVLGGDPVVPTYKNDLDSVVHLQLLEIKESTVLLAGEVDAMNKEGQSVEVKFATSNKRAIRAIFQMIGNSSLRLCRGKPSFRKRQTPSLTMVKMERLQEYASRVTEHEELRNLGRTLSSRVDWLRHHCESRLKEGEVQEVQFEDDGSGIKMTPSSSVTIDDLFPKIDTVKDLLS